MDDNKCTHTNNDIRYCLLRVYFNGRARNNEVSSWFAALVNFLLTRRVPLRQEKGYELETATL
jgi:hypothetical protein